MNYTNIVDFFSKLSYKDIASKDFKSNGELTDKFGVYLGCLMEQDSKAIRNLMGDLEFINHQITHLTSDWERLYSEHQILLQYCLDFLRGPNTKNINNINTDKDSVMISENGHVWVIYDYEEIIKKD